MQDLRKIAIAVVIYSKAAGCLASVTKIEHFDTLCKDLTTISQKSVL